MNRGALLVIAATLFVHACAGASDSAPTPTTTAPSGTPRPSTAAPAPIVPHPAVQVSAPACGYGGSAPAVSVFIDVTTAVALSGVSVSFTLADLATGTPSGFSREPENLVVSPIDRGLLDFSTQGTSPFDGSLAAGSTTRLEYWAGLGIEVGSEAAPGFLSGPLRVNVVVHTNEGVYTTTCDTAQMWPSS